MPYGLLTTPKGVYDDEEDDNCLRNLALLLLNQTFNEKKKENCIKMISLAIKFIYTCILASVNFVR